MARASAALEEVRKKEDPIVTIRTSNRTREKKSSEHPHIMETYYTILGVPEAATKEQIREAYYAKAKQYHPDSGKTPDEAARLNDMFIQVNRAYQVLKTDEKRREYDTYLKNKRLDNKYHAQMMNATSGKPKPPTPEPTGPDVGRGITRTPAKRPNVTETSSSPRVNPGNGGADLEQQASNKEKNGGASVSASSGKLHEKGTTEEGLDTVMKLIQGGHLHKAREKIRWLLKVEPNNAMYYSLAAFLNAQLKTGLRDALLAAEKAIQLEPNKSLHHFHLGMVYEVAGQESKAQESYQKALELDPGNSEARKALDKFSHKESFWRKNFNDFFKKKK